MFKLNDKYKEQFINIKLLKNIIENIIGRQKCLQNTFKYKIKVKFRL